MPINAGPQYTIAERKFSDAKSKEQKIEALEGMIRALPKHKGTDHLIAQLKKRISKLRKEVIGGGKKGNSSFSLKKEGSAQVCIIGPTQVGKSSLLKSITNAHVKISNIPFTTKIPKIGMMFYQDIPIQIIEIPSKFEPIYISIIRNSDLVLILVDATKNVLEQEKYIKKILVEKAINKKIILVRNKRYNNKSKYLNISSEENLGLEKLKKRIWSSLNLIRVYTKSPNGPKRLPPVSMKPGSTVKELTEKIHKEFLKNFKFARIFNDTIYSGKKVGLDYILHDMDIMEIHTDV